MPDTCSVPVYIISFSSFNNAMKYYLLFIDAKLKFTKLVGNRIGIST